MTRPAIRAEHLSKRYRLGLTHDGSLRELVNRSWRRLSGRGTSPPGTRPQDEADRHRIRDGHFWALQDVSFEVEPGEVIGIIGQNGAGKSTLLKILSRITRPTTGRVTLRGRVASLLEVGTGFHPELTGRENVYMNGTILGMTRREIDRRFDEIVAFAGVEAFIDTPVKRYSSGMTVRLGFAVAAHLDPEILIVDEVLAVGDSGFQRKCADAMQAIRSSGRSIILVSHNMTSIRTLCTRCLLLSQGEVIDAGDAAAISQRYLADRTRDLATEATFAAEAGSDRLPRLRSARLRADGLAGGMWALGSDLQSARLWQPRFAGGEVCGGLV
ncbi:MAG: ABC transporter ATP-binding protein, partial [Maioricimonas sp. JB049]